MGKTCLICSKSFDKKNSRTFHKFPKNVVIWQKWMNVIGYKRLLEPFPVSHNYVCSDHFSKEDYYESIRGNEFLRREAIPKFNLFEINEISDSNGRPADIQVNNNITELEYSNGFNTIKTEDEKVEYYENLRCRCCFTIKTNKVYLRVADNYIENITLQNVIEQIIPNLKVEIKEDDFVCEDCVEILKSTMSFKANCLKVDFMLWQSLNNGNEIEASNEENLKTKEIEDISENVDSFYDDENHSQVDENILKNNILLYEEFDQSAVKDAEFKTTILVNDDKKDEKIIMNNADSTVDKTVSENNDVSTEVELWNQLSTSYNATRMMNLELQSSVNLENYDKLITVKSLTNHVLVAFLKQLQKKVHAVQYGTFDGGNQRILLLGSISWKKCSACEQQFSSEQNLKEHFEQDHQTLARTSLIKPFIKTPNFESLECNVCNSKFRTIRVLRLHAKYCMMLICPFCNEGFAEINFCKHTEDKHKEPFPFKCFECNQSFQYYQIFNAHRCDVKIFDEIRETKKLVEIKKTKKCVRKPKTKKCKICEEMIPSHLYKVHMEFHGVTFSFRQKTYQKRICPECGKLIVNQHYTRHMLTIHNKTNETFKCSICNKLFKRQKTLKNHMKTHKTPLVICEFCGIKCRSDSLKNHYYLKHSASNNYSCSVCNETFPRKDYLARHVIIHDIKNKTTKQKIMLKNSYGPVTCKYCLKTFAKVFNLKLHLKTHFELHRSKCRYCDLTYSNLGNRLRHEKVHKDPNYKFRCHTCWKQFSNEKELDIHESKHTRKYVCEYCNKRFARHFTFISHQIEVHCDKEEIKKETEKLFSDSLRDHEVVKEEI